MIVNADSQDVKLILNGVELTNPSGFPMVVTAADEVTLILADGTENTISDADTSGDNPQGFTITGGAVTIDSEGDELDSNAAGTISGGSVVILGPTMGETARSTCGRG